MGVGITACVCTAVPVTSQSDPNVITGYNSYGSVGLIDMPVATSRPDGEFAFTMSSFAEQTRYTLTFQITPRLSGSFRYSVLEDFLDTPSGPSTLYDRSSSLHYRLIDEDTSGMRPAIAVGFNDFLGTGVYSSEYIVATKTVAPKLRFSAGIGWGRLGSSRGFTNPLSIFSDKFKSRPGRDGGDQGGDVDFGQFFRGDAALFGGLEWQVTDKLKLIAEYSSDKNREETRFAFDSETQLNFGVTYGLGPMTQLSLRYLYGSELGVQLSTALNPKFPPNHAGRDPAPPPVLGRDAPTVAALGWTDGVIERDALRGDLARALESLGLKLHGFSLSGDTARIEIENETYHQEAQAVGRTARVLTRRLPAHFDVFDITLVDAGLPISQVSLRRGDMETLEHDLDGAWNIFARSQISAPAGSTSPVPDRYPGFDWNILPYLSPSLFDPDDPLRADAGAQFEVSLQPMPGLEFSGILRQKIVGNLDDATRRSDSILPRVRSDFALYDREGETSLTQLTGAQYFKPGRDLYGRVTVGYLERMFGGVSSELLWKRNNSPFALGAEVNYVKQRDFDGGFGFQDYDAFTGHASAYWDIGDGFHAQVDAGRYLAQDWGATFALDREFGNGWRIGAFATFTDVSFDDFGEGSFDKGIRITLPIRWLTGEPSKTAYTTTIRPVQRDGGARLNVPGRLYERVRPRQKPALQDGWGRFWR